MTAYTPRMTGPLTVRALDCPSSPPAAIRHRRLALLTEPQESFLERLVTSGSTWLFEQRGRCVGYAVVEGEGTLLEIFWEEALGLEPEALFRDLAAKAGLRRALCQSFNRQAISFATAAPGRIRAVGLLFRKIVDTGHERRSDVSMRLAGPGDLDAVAALDDGFFHDEDEIRAYLDIAGLFVLETAENDIAGCGVVRPVLPGGTDVDIGMLVAPGSRRQGYGAFIISYLKARCLAKNLRPICGCGIRNIGSRKAIQRAGFVADHRLLSIEY